MLQDHDLAAEPLMFQRAVARAAKFPWTFATTADLGWATRKLPLQARLLRWYSGRVIAAIPGHRQVYRAYVRVSQLAGHPVALLRPAVLFRVLPGEKLSGRRPRATAP